MRSINWTFTFILGLLLALIAPVSLVAGLILYLEIFHTPYAAALGWLLYFIPLNAIGGLVVGVIEGIIFSMLYQKRSAKVVWISIMIVIALASIANSYEVWTVGVITFILNLLLLVALYRFLVHDKT